MANVHQNSSSHGSQIYVFKLLDIDCCKDCPRKLEKALRKLDGIESAKVDERQKLATVEGLIDPTEIIRKINKWEKKAELVTDNEETNPHGYTVESNDEDGGGEKEDLLNASRRHKDSSSSQKDSSARHKRSFFGMRGKNKGSSHAPEKKDNSKSEAPSRKEIPEHICRDKYCKIHKRDDFTEPEHEPDPDPKPKMNNDTSYQPFYPGIGHYNHHPMMNSYVPPPPMYAPPSLRPYGQYYGPRMQIPRPRPNGFTNYSGDEYRNGCNNM